PALPDDGGSGAFPPGHFKDPTIPTRVAAGGHRWDGPGRAALDIASFNLSRYKELLYGCQTDGLNVIPGLRKFVLVQCVHLTCLQALGIKSSCVSEATFSYPFPSCVNGGNIATGEERISAVIKLQLQAEERGVVSIKGVSANRFLAMKEDGRLLALKCATEECFFFERLESNNYNTYRSRKYSDWYVALKRTGQYKPGPKTGPGQKAILFLPMSAKS
ncbi:PREDICTED: fibroblast growth factor 2, partial [Chlamydotis macqueenii]|uniref:fibroblast growth factor 2 n=1 Tax=Chlamydotis macqueenii TaxID=187382 RepID=UPI000529B072